MFSGVLDAKRFETLPSPLVEVDAFRFNPLSAFGYGRLRDYCFRNDMWLCMNIRNGGCTRREALFWPNY